MKTKIKWFKEVLELEPGSKVFFPLARMYYEDGLIDEAEETLLQGLERNPDHLEARFLLVEILDRQGEPIRAADEVGAITKVLSRYPAFWKTWSETAAPQSRDAAMALSFLAANFQGRPISWSQVIAKGLDALVGDGPVHAAMPEPTDEPEAEADEGPTTRTRTMADLLAEQGDYQGALDIYEELLVKGETNGEGDLPTRIALMRAELGMDDAEDDLVPPAPSEAVAAQSLGGGSLDETVADFLGGLMPAGAGAQEETAPEEATDFDEPAELEAAPDFDAAVDEDAAPAEAMETAQPEAEPESMADDLELPEIEALDEAVDEPDGLAVAEASEAAEPGPAEAAEAEPAPMPGKEALMQTLEALADRLEARSAL